MHIYENEKLLCINAKNYTKTDSEEKKSVSKRARNL